MAPVPYSPIAETARAAAGGLIFQSADELEAALRSGAISGPEYTKIRDQLRAQQGQFRQDMPGQALAADIGGS
jgi:predicted RNA-binding protein associated with RNAse of E/G family